MNYIKLLPRIASKHRGKGNYRFKFENHDYDLPLKAFITSCLCVAKCRPTNHTITQLAWPVISDNYSDVSEYAAGVFQWNNIVQFDYHKSEEFRQSMSYATKDLNNGNSKGCIVAIDVETYRPKFIYGPGDARSFGFNPENIYATLNKRNAFTHRGHVFVREHEVFAHE